MSHEATIWAIRQTGKGLSPGVKLVLWHLADRHNPDFGCFPKQIRLAADCEMSRSTINEHLKTLEAKGLIRRLQQVDPKTKQQRTTRYIFAFEAGFDGSEGDEGAHSAPLAGVKNKDETPCPDSGHGPKPVSGNDGIPCPDLTQSRVRLSGHVEPVREPLKEPIVSGATVNTHQDFDEFWKVHPRQRDQDRCRKIFEDAVRSGVRSEWIVRAAGLYGAENAGNKRMYICYADNWLDRRGWEEYPEKPVFTPRNEVVSNAAAFWAAKMKAGRFVAASAISAEVAACMVANGMVAAADLQRLGVDF